MRQSNGHRLTVFGNAFDHGLTYAVGDQRSLLNNHLGYDVIVIPGAVGTSARHAAGSFAAVLGKPYVVDPRSWLFQLTPETRVDDRLQYSRLAKEHGDRLGAIVSARALSVRDLGDSALLEELVTTMLNYQGTLEASAGRQKITQWERMLGRQIRPASDRALPFALVPPYFSCKSALPSGSSDDHRWFEANVELARIATNLKVDHPLCPVICMSQEMLRAERSAVIDAYRDQNFDGFSC